MKKLPVEDVTEMYPLSAATVLLGTSSGLYLADLGVKPPSVIPADGDANSFMGQVDLIHELAGTNLLMAEGDGDGSADVFKVDVSKSPPVVYPSGSRPTGFVYKAVDLPGHRVLLAAQNGLFEADFSANPFLVVPATGSPTGGMYDILQLSGGDALVGADKGLLQVHISSQANLSEHPPVVAALTGANTGKVTQIFSTHSNWVLLSADHGLFLANLNNNKATSIVALRGAKTGGVEQSFNIGKQRVLILADDGMFWVDLSKSLPVTEGFSNNFTPPNYGFEGTPGPINQTLSLPGDRTLIAWNNSLYLADFSKTPAALGLAAKDPISVGDVNQFVDVPGYGILFADEGQLYLGNFGETQPVIPANGAEMGDIRHLLYLTGHGLLISTLNGLYLADLNKKPPFVEPVTETDDGGGWLFNVPGTGILRAASDLSDPDETDLSLINIKPLSEAEVENDPNLDRDTIDMLGPKPISFDISAHPCTSVANTLGLSVRVSGPDGSRVMPADVTQGETATATVLVKVDKPGSWQFQLISTSYGGTTNVGRSQAIQFITPSTGSSFLSRSFWGWLVVNVVGLLIILNFVFYIFARRSAWAWRIATDDSWSGTVLRVATLLLSHLTFAQLWILDYFFNRVRRQILRTTPRLCLPMPLTAMDDELQESNKVLSAPWKEHRLWIRGASGMGKTTLFQDITESHFRSHETSFEAYGEWGCIIVAFSARDFPGRGEDSDDPSWVFNAVRDTLSSEGLNFRNANLLDSFLDNGTIAVAIDGLNEVDRTLSVIKFAKTYSNVPMLITSQSKGKHPFKTWTLPDDIHDFILRLLKLHSGPDEGEALFASISEAGLTDEILSGYDVMLIIYLAQAGAALPKDRLGLYHAVVEIAWPKAPERERKEQQSRLANTAWRMVSERFSNEDMRRIQPSELLDSNFLQNLSETSEGDKTAISKTTKRHVRLLRRVGYNSFEFVHDQMHAYLAACWFAQPGVPPSQREGQLELSAVERGRRQGFSPAELEEMAASSMIWKQSPDAKYTLWGFVAPMLDDVRLEALWDRTVDKDEWIALWRSLEIEAEARGLKLTKTPRKSTSRQSANTRPFGKPSQ